MKLHDVLLFSVLFVAASSGSLAGPADSLSLQETVDLVLSRNPAVREAESAVSASEARLRQSRSSTLPSADLEGSYAHLSPIGEIDFFGGTFRTFPANSYDGHLTLHQTLYDFDRSGSSIDLASARTQIAADAVETVKRDLAFRTAQTFYSILYLQKSISVADEQIQTLNEHLSVARKKVATGSATELDVLTIQVRAGSAENQKIRLESALRQQEASLRRLASLPPDAPVYLHGEFTRNPLRFDQDSLLRTARANRIELQTANHEVEAATLQQRVARRTDAPSIRASVAYGVKNGYLPNLEVLRGNYVAGVGVNVPIFDGNRSRSMEEEATASLQGAEARRQDVGLRIQADVQQAIADAQSALARVRVSEINILQAEKALQVARVRYDAGAVPNLDLLDAENERSQASLLNLEALYDYVNGILLLQRATGEPFSLQ